MNDFDLDKLAAHWPELAQRSGCAAKDTVGILKARASRTGSRVFLPKLVATIVKKTRFSSGEVNRRLVEIIETL